MKTAADRKSWFSMPRVAASWWSRTSVPPPSPPAVRCVAEIVEISAPIMAPPPPPPSPPPPDTGDVDEVEYVNGGVETAAGNVPSICFSFFADSSDTATIAHVEPPVAGEQVPQCCEVREVSCDGEEQQAVVVEEEGVYQNERYASEYSIFIGKAVELCCDPQDGLMIETAYSSPRHSALSCRESPLSETPLPQTPLRETPLPQTPLRETPLPQTPLRESPVRDIKFTATDDQAPSVARFRSSSTTKSLTDLHRRDAIACHVKASSQDDVDKVGVTRARFSLRKLSDKYVVNPSPGSRGGSGDRTRRSEVANYGNLERPPEPPPLPPADWHDHEASVVSTATTSPSHDDDINYEDVEEYEYCQQRAKSRRGTLTRTGNKRPGIVRVRSRLGRVVRAVSGWWSEERVKLGEVIQKHAHAQAVGVVNMQSETVVATEDAPVVHLDPNGGGEDEVDADTGMETTPRVRRTPKRPVSRAGLRRSRYFPEGQNGFEELRRFIKQGGDFCKDLSSILQERSEAETQYAKSLSKLSCKLIKASKDSVGTVNQAWQRAGTQMEAQSEIHRAFASALSEEVVKPLRQMVETQHRIRKSVEAAVDKTGKSLSEWRAAETKSKKQSFLSARENEKLQDAMLDVRLGRTGSTHALHHSQNQKIVSDKESAKLEAKRRKAEDNVKKADVEYYTFCIRAERARLEWETAVIRGSHCFQAVEEERLQNLKDIASRYLQHLQEMGPKVVEITERLSEPVMNCDVSRDIQTVVSIKGTGQPIPEQLLPDFYAEHITLAMNRDRRRNALVKLLQLVRQDLDRERRGKQGVENLARALQETPTFGAEDSQQNVTEKLHHMRSMLTYLEAARYKVQSALAELDGRARGPHPLASHIQVTRDRQGLQQSVLKVPPWVRKESIDRMAGDSPDWTDRGAADGNSVQPDSDFDEFSSQGSEKDYQSSILTYPVISECSESTTSCGNTGQCKALYEYSANLYDELNLRPGDVINIHDKQPDGWWFGELNGVVGIFPATYVEEIK